jgi:2-phospho-L-lactate/phosphoenolpyruvate guanylyltransferase
MMSGLWCVLPLRGMALGKSRLSPALDVAARARLNRWLFARTLHVVGAWFGDLARCVVVSRCGEVFARAHEAGATVLCEIDRSSDQNRTALLGAGYAMEQGARWILALPGDLPELHGNALDALAAAARPGHLVIAPDAAGTGTNAVLFEAGRHVRFHFGPESAARYANWATRCGLGYSMHHVGGVAFDLDTPADLALWRMRSGGSLPVLDAAGGEAGAGRAHATAASLQAQSSQHRPSLEESS